MAISTKAELHTAVANWLNRSDLTDRIPEFIALAEAQLNRNLRTREMLVRKTSPLATQYVNLPPDYLEMTNIELTSTSPPKRLVYATSDRLDDYRAQQNNATGVPVYYTIEGTTIQILPTPDKTYTLQINYFRDISALATLADSGNNWLLIAHPDIYLYGTLLQSAPYLMDPQSIGSWGTLYAQAMQELQLVDEKSRYSGGTLNMRSKYIYT
jgi:hypothetical protein